jgi:hypothetical protein
VKSGTHFTKLNESQVELPTETIPATQEVEVDKFEASLVKKHSKTLSQENKPDVLAYACEPSYLRGL